MGPYKLSKIERLPIKVAASQRREGTLDLVTDLNRSCILCEDDLLHASTTYKPVPVWLTGNRLCTLVQKDKSSRKRALIVTHFTQNERTLTPNTRTEQLQIGQWQIS